MFTEEEAKTKWCHERNNRYQLINIAGLIAASLAITVEDKETALDQVLKNQDTESPACIASECIMWLWKDDPRFLGYCGLTRRNE